VCAPHALVAEDLDGNLCRPFRDVRLLTRSTGTHGVTPAGVGCAVTVWVAVTVAVVVTVAVAHAVCVTVTVRVGALRYAVETALSVRVTVAGAWTCNGVVADSEGLETALSGLVEDAIGSPVVGPGIAPDSSDGPAARTGVIACPVLIAASTNPARPNTTATTSSIDGRRTRCGGGGRVIG
jgi:hypothetical protein